MNIIYRRKGDSLDSLSNGINVYNTQVKNMNTAVILNQSGVFQGNEWKGRRHYPVFPSGYQLPVQSLLPLASLKQLSIGKTNSKWTNLNGVYSPQMPTVPIFNLTPASVKPPGSSPVIEPNQRRTRISHASTSVPKFSTVIKTTAMQRSQYTTQHIASTNIQLNTTANQINQTTSILTGHVPESSSDVTQVNTGHNFGGYMIENLVRKPSNSTNVKTQSNSSVELTELSPYKTAPNSNKTMQVKQREILQTRKRSSSWPIGSGLSKKKSKDGLTKDDQIVEEYKNLEMDVARILVSDIPFPVVSTSDKCLAKSEGGQADVFVPVHWQIRKTKKRDEGVIQWNAVTRGTHTQDESRSTLGNEGLVGLKAQVSKSNLPGGGMFNEQIQMSPARSGADKEQGKQSQCLRNECSSVETRNEMNKVTVGSGSTIGPKKQRDSTYQRSGQTGVIQSTEKDENGSNLLSARIVGAGRPADMSPVGSDRESKKKESPLWSGQGAESEKQMNALDACIAVVQKPNKQGNNSASTGKGLESEKTSIDLHPDSDTSLHLENEKENYSKNLTGLNKVVFTCQQCVVSFESMQDLLSHTASHANTNFTLKCNVCTQVFRSTNGLQKHIEFHVDHRNNFQCSFCFKPFPDRDSLEEHIIGSHMSKRPHKCSYCPKAFRDPGSLQKHVRIHTGERPYKCTACDKSFAEYSSLRKHYRVHTGEQPYKCQYCTKAFSISGNLQRHILIHTGERPYKCSECSKTFNNPSHLRRHEKNLHSKLEREK